LVSFLPMPSTTCMAKSRKTQAFYNLVLYTPRQR
jgi:hypothetical protein